MINLEKYVDAFCFSALHVSENGDKLFYLWQKDNEKGLYSLDLNNNNDLKTGSKVIEKDFSAGSFSIHYYDKQRNFLYLILDQENKENFNLWRLDLGPGQLTPVTNFSYVGGITYSEDHSICWCYSKDKLDDGTFHSSVYEINLLTLEKKFLFSDKDQAYRIGWTPMAKLPNADALVFTVDYLNQRKKTNVCRYSLSKKEWERLLPVDLEESGNPSLCEDNPSNEGVLIESVHEGFQNIYFYSFENKTLKKITNLDKKNEGISVLDKMGKKSINVVIKEGNNFLLEIYDLEKNKRFLKLKSLTYFLDTKQDYWGIQTSSDSVKKLVCLNENGTETKSLVLTSYPAAELEHTVTTWVSYPSFDGKEVKALLHLPTGELKAACILAFYGGEEFYSIQAQHYAEHGIALLSPAVRGSWGWGREWEKMLEGDLGGNEILDVIWGAKYLEKKLNLAPAKIGVVGGSHGGYATLRAITMPQNYNNISNTQYCFGFAVSDVGFADLIAFYNDSRIADWLVHLLGPYDEKKYLDRSPLTYFENLITPLLIINGKNDSRVPFSTMEKFIEKLKNSNKDYKLLIHEDQGHGSSNRKTSLLELEAEANFLKRFI